MKIGVWVGHATSFLSLLQQDDEHLFLCDVQIQKDSIETLRKAVGCIDESNYTTLEVDSALLRKKRSLAELYGNFRFFHIDGEHSYEAAYSDLEFAFDCIDKRGIVACDDFLIPMSLCATQAVFDFLANNRDRARLFLAGYGKAFLTTPFAYTHYRNFCCANLLNVFDAIEKPATLCVNGWNVQADYLTVIERRAEGKLVTIGRFHEELL